MVLMGKHRDYGSVWGRVDTPEFDAIPDRELEGRTLHNAIALDVIEAQAMADLVNNDALLVCRWQSIPIPRPNRNYAVLAVRVPVLCPGHVRAIVVAVVNVLVRDVCGQEPAPEREGKGDHRFHLQAA